MSAQRQNAAAAGEDALSGRPVRPAGYWERVARIVDQAPPLDDTQRARLRVIFHQNGKAKGNAA